MNKIAFAVENINTANLIIAEHFGRCQGFKVFEVDNENNIINEVFAGNPLVGTSSGTCELPHYVNQLGVNTIIAGGMGPKAIHLFESYNINVITAPGLAVKDAIEMFLKGEIAGYEPCENHSH